MGTARAARRLAGIAVLTALAAGLAPSAEAAWVPPGSATKIGPARPSDEKSIALVLRTDEVALARHHRARAAAARTGVIMAPLSPRTVAARFGARPQSIRAVRAWSAARGLEAKVGRLRTHVKLTGTATAIARAVGLPRLHRYRGDGRRVYVASDQAPKVPRKLRPHVRAVAGLEHGLLPVREGPREKPPEPIRSSQTTPVYSPSGFDCARSESFTDSTGVTRMTPFGAARVYGMDQVGSSPTAPKQTIAVFAFNDVPDQTYWKAYVEACRFGSGPDPTLSVKNVDDAPDKTDLVEALLDTTLAGAFAPANTKIVVVNGNDADYQTNWLDMAEEVVALVATSKTAGAPLTALSMSWGTWQGECASYVGKCVAPTMNSLTDAQFSRLGAMGVSLTASSGDFGSHGSRYSTRNPKNICARPTPPGKPATSWPHSSPWVTGVGSTQWGDPPNNAGVATAGGKVVPRSAETTWDQRTPKGDNPCIYDGASGGAQSLLYPVPAWQRSAPGFPAPGGSKPPMRQVPDVSVLGSDGPYFVSPVGGMTSPFGDWWGGGTSGANPVFATGILRVNADRLAAGLPPLGHLNPVLYGALAADAGSYADAFHDITTGNNNLFDVGCCSAQPGYDMTTGLGSPNFGSQAWAALRSKRT